MFQVHVHLETSLWEFRVPLCIRLHKLGASIHEKVQRAHLCYTRPILVIAPRVGPLYKRLVKDAIVLTAYPLLCTVQKLEIPVPCMRK